MEGADWSVGGFVVDAFASFFFQDSFFSRGSRWVVVGFSSVLRTGGGVGLFWDAGGGVGTFVAGGGVGFGLAPFVCRTGNDG